jgi:hyperpolarization activated cyclic nucleotide-gated potassium channel 2
MDTSRRSHICASNHRHPRRKSNASTVDMNMTSQNSSNIPMNASVIRLLQEAIQRLQTTRASSHKPNNSVMTNQKEMTDCMFAKERSGMARFSQLFGDEKVKAVLGYIFELLDFDKDGCLNKDEASYIADYILNYRDHLLDTDIDRFLDVLMPQLWNVTYKIDFPTFMAMVEQSLYLDCNHIHGLPQLRRLKSEFLSGFCAHHRQAQSTRIGNDMLIHPGSRFNKYWEAIISFFYLSMLITIPLVIAWTKLIPRLFLLHMMIDIFLLLDVVKSFFTGVYQIEDGTLVMKRSLIRQYYFRHHFAFDMLIATPFDLYWRVRGIDLASKKLHLLNVMRLVKFARLYRLKSLMNHMEAWAYHMLDLLSLHFSDGFVKLVRLFFYFTILAHWSGCFQFLLVRLYDFPEDSWVRFAGLEARGVYAQWQWSYFKSLAQMILIGFQSPPFVSASCNTMSEWCQIEMWVTLLVGLFPGAVFFSLLIVSITRIAETNTLKNRRFEEHLNNLSGFLDREKFLCPSERFNIKADFVKMHRHGCFYDERDALSDMGPHRADFIHQARTENMASQCPLFCYGQNRALLRAMTRHMERVSYRRGEVVLDEIDHGEFMFFVESGLIDLFTNKDQLLPFMVLKTGDSFGYESLYLSTSMLVKAQTESILFRISREDWIRVMDTHPEYETIWYEDTKEKLNRARNFQTMTAQTGEI